MKLRILLIALLFSAGFVNAKETIKIGAVIPLTGNNAHIGEEMRNGMIMATEELKGKNTVEVKTYFEDDQMELRQTNLAALRLIQLEKVDVLVSVWTPSANLLAPIVDREKVISFNTGWDTSVTEKSPWTIVHGGNLKEFARTSVEIMKLRNAKHVAVARMTHLGLQKVFEAAQPLMKEAGIEIVFDEPFTPGLRDFRTYVLKIKESKPDFVWNLSFNPEDEIFYRTAKELGINLPTTGYYASSPKTLYAYIDGALTPHLFTTQDFQDRYEKRFGKKPRLLEAGTAYDMVILTSAATNDLYKRLGRLPTHAELLAELKYPREMTHLSVGNARMTSQGYIESHYTIIQIKDSQLIDYAP